MLTVHASGRTFVSISGPLDIATREHLEDALLSALSGTEEHAVLEVDVSDVDFVDSTGALGLMAARAAALDRGVDMVLTNPSRQLRFLLEVLGQIPAEGGDGRAPGREVGRAQ